MIKATIRHSDRFDVSWTTARLTVNVTFASAPPLTPQADVTAPVHPRSEPVPDDTAAQTLAIGANVVSFQAGFTARERQDIIDCLVLARLAATENVTSPRPFADAPSWFGEFVNTLANIGFHIVQRGIPELPGLRREFNVVDIMGRAGRDVGNEELQAWLLVATRALRQIAAAPRDSAIARIVHEDATLSGAQRLQTTVIGRDTPGNVKLVAVTVVVEAPAPVENIFTARFDQDLTRFDAGYAIFDVNMQALQATRDAIAKRLDPLRPQTEHYVRAFPDPVDMEAREP